MVSHTPDSLYFAVLAGASLPVSSKIYSQVETNRGVCPKHYVNEWSRFMHDESNLGSNELLYLEVLRRLTHTNHYNIVPLPGIRS